jgi:hypothetical protein
MLGGLGSFEVGFVMGGGLGFYFIRINKCGGLVGKGWIGSGQVTRAELDRLGLDDAGGGWDEMDGLDEIK